MILVFVIWYPGLLAQVTGVDEIFFLVLAVDASLGPLLTLVVFNLKKKELRRDLAIIFTLQIAALFYRLYTVSIARPAYVVFEIDRFQLVYANDLTVEKLREASSNEYKSLPYFGPRWVIAQLPENIDARNKFLFSVIEGGEDLAQFPKFYTPLKESKNEIITKSIRLTELKNFNQNNLTNYENLIEKYSAIYKR